jgi:hypothetical protein
MRGEIPQHQDPTQPDSSTPVWLEKAIKGDAKIAEGRLDTADSIASKRFKDIEDKNKADEMRGELIDLRNKLREVDQATLTTADKGRRSELGEKHSKLMDQMRIKLLEMVDAFGE